MRGYGAPVMFAVAAFGAMCGARPVTAATWHVAADGSAQFQSIQKAIDAARDGDTILIRAGRYVEDVTVHSKARLKIIGEDRERVVIAGLNRVGTLHIGKWPYGATDVEISGLTIQQHGGLGVGIFNGERIVLKDLRVNGQVFGQEVRDVRIEHCDVGGSETTGLAFADSDATLTDNTIHDNDHGVSVGGTSTVHLERNVVTRNLFEAVLAADNAQVTLLQNTLANNGGGVAFQDNAGGRVEGNIITGAKVGIAWGAQSEVTIARNGLYDNGVDYLVGGKAVVATEAIKAFAGVYASPMFVAPERGDYRLKEDSPMWNVGGFAYLGAVGVVE